MPTRKKTVYAKTTETPLQAAARELQTLEPLFKLPITKLGLDGWVGGSSPRAELVADTIWGTIRWPTRIHVLGHTYLDIEPAVQHFVKPKSRLVLAPFEVVAKPYSRVGG